MSYTSWNDYFKNYHDNTEPEKPKPKTRTYDDFENDYRRMYGKWFDHHYLELIQKHGAEKADIIIKQNVEKLNEKVKQQIREEQIRYDWKEIPENAAIPF